MIRKAYIMAGRIVHALSFWFFAFTSRKTTRTRLAVVHGKEVLVVQNWYDNLTWSLPGGGAKGHENFFKAAKRELNEELGVMLGDEYDQKLEGHYRHKFYQSKFVIFVVHLDTKPAVIRNRLEINSYMWTDIAKLSKLKCSEDLRLFALKLARHD